MRINPNIMNRINTPSPFWLLLFIFIISIPSCKNSAKIQADFLITNANIYTVDENQSHAEAMAILGDSIIFVGSNEDARQFDSQNTIDAEGKFIIPGFIDTHIHFMQGGNNLSSVQLRDADSKEEFINRIADHVKTLSPGVWITGGDWDHENWGGELPQRAWIDSVSPDNPVFINRLDGHMSLANSAALDASNIDENVEDVEGGEIIRVNGMLTGIFKDNAASLINRTIPDLSENEKRKHLLNAMNYVNSHGVTTVHDMGSFSSLETYEMARKDSLLTVRIYSFTLLSEHKKALSRKSEFSSDYYLKMGGLKGFVDGSLGSHTAAFFEGFTDAPDEYGFFVSTKENLYSYISEADKNGLQVTVHAIGDSANHTLLSIFKQVSDENGPRDRRFRVEHAQHLSPDDISKFSEWQIIPSMQPYHAIDDGRWAEKVIGPERIKTTYAFRQLLDANARLTFGSDWFVAPPIPLEGIYAAVTRSTLDGKNPEGWVPEQKIKVEEAIYAYTMAGAYAGFDENIKGSLEPGKLADFVILDQDITAIDPHTIKDVTVLETWVGGKKVYERE